MYLSAPSGVNLEGRLEYTITVKNNSDSDFHDIVLQNKLDNDKVIYIASVPEGSWNGERGVITWKLDKIIARESKIFKIKTTVVDGGNVRNRARIKCRERIYQKVALQTQVFGGTCTIQHDIYDRRKRK